MCEIGDIIVINNYTVHGQNIGRHSFVVMDDNNGEICGLSYDFICNVLSSFKSKDQQIKKLSYPGNFPVMASETDVVGNQKNGYAKVDQLFYFNKSKIDYVTIGKMHQDTFNRLMAYIEYMAKRGMVFEKITDNL